MEMNKYIEEVKLERKFELLKETVNAIIHGTTPFRKYTLAKLIGINVDNFTYNNRFVSEINLRKMVAKNLGIRVPKPTKMALHLMRNGINMNEPYTLNERLYLYLECIDLSNAKCKYYI